MVTLFKRNSYAAAAQDLYDQALAQSRQARFYTDMGVPDTLDGRFEMLVLQVFVRLYPLMQRGDRASRDLSQAVFDVMFATLDRSMRENGVGDLAVPKRMKKMMAAFNGRVQTYYAALAAGDDVLLSDAVMRNVYAGAGDPQHIAALVAYIQGQISLPLEGEGRVGVHR